MLTSNTSLQVTLSKSAATEEDASTAPSNLIYNDLYNDDFSSLETAMEEGENYVHGIIESNSVY